MIFPQSDISGCELMSPSSSPDISVDTALHEALASHAVCNPHNGTMHFDYAANGENRAIRFRFKEANFTVQISPFTIHTGS